MSETNERIVTVLGIAFGPFMRMADKDTVTGALLIRSSVGDP